MHDTLIINIPLQKEYTRYLGADEWGIVGDLHMYDIRTYGGLSFDPITKQTMYYDLYHPFEKLPSSFSDMAVKFYHSTKNCLPYVALNASPKFIQGHNICGVESIEQLAFEMMGVFKDYYPVMWAVLDIKNAYISRIDVTYSTRLPHDDLMINVIDMVGRISVGQRKPDVKRNKYLTSRYWNTATNRYGYCKMYGKEDEVGDNIKKLQRKASKGNRQAQTLLDQVFTDDIAEFAKNLLRFEATTKKEQLHRFGMPSNLWQFMIYQRLYSDTNVRMWHKWFDPILNSMQGEIMTNIDDSEVLQLCKDKLFTVTTKGNITYTKAMSAYRFYCFVKDKGFVHAKSVTDRATFYRNVKSLVDIGIPKSHLQNLDGRENKSVALCEMIKFDFSNQAPSSYIPPKSRYADEFSKYLIPELQLVA